MLQAGDQAVAKQDRCPFFGEMALLDNKPRMASVVTASPSKLLKLTSIKFNNFLEEVRRRTLGPCASPVACLLSCCVLA